jgi:enoyl-[acyl-carrier protein] reductase/trans-2-enoyl-CoA reductase (NAD+)
LYWEGTIGAAKKDLDRKVKSIRQQIKNINGDARVSVLKAVVTQSSSAIPVMPLYLSILFKEMKSRGTHEDCIQQLYRLLTTRLFSDGENYDIEGRYRVDDYELDRQVQKSVSDAWSNISDESLALLADFDEYKRSFLRLFGFEIAGIDYSRDVDPEKVIPGIINL